MITLDLRHAIGRAVADEGFGPPRGGPGLSRGGPGPCGPNGAVDPGLRPGREPGQYASSVAFGLASRAQTSRARTSGGQASGAQAARAGKRLAEIAARLAARLEAQEPWIAKAEVTGQGYVTITVAPEALGSVAGRVIAAGPGCVRSDALAGRTHKRPADADPLDAATWEEARELLAAELTARLAEAAGATVAETEAAGATVAETEAAGAEAEAAGHGTGATIRSGEREPEPTAAVAFAGRDAVRFFLARALPDTRISIDQRQIARHHPANPAYAVRYAHARAASGVRWAATTTTGRAGPQRPSADPGDLALLGALSWLPERVATAARRGRPDEFARYLERLAGVTLEALTRPGSDTLVLARAARTGLAAGLGLLGVSAPDRL